jgi:tetratricopeptide (TPR) repeat protein
MSAAGEIAAMQLQLERDPGSLVFLSLGETHRRRGDLEAALTIAERGVSWYPEMAGAWDLLGRVRSDRGEGDLAFEAWTTVLRLDPEHAGAHRGMAFLAYRAGELDRSLRYLRRAVELGPDDAGLRRVYERVARQAEAQRGAPPPKSSPLAAVDWGGSALLVDLQGGWLEGELVGPGGAIAAERIAPALAGLSRDAERTTRLLGLGPWNRIALKGGVDALEIRSPTIDSLLVMVRPGTISPEALGSAADRLAASVRHWLETVR